MKNLIQIISTLSLTAGKYIYGELYKKRKKESFVRNTLKFVLSLSQLQTTQIYLE